MCMIVLDKDVDVVGRTFPQPRDTPIVAYKVFRRDSLHNFRSILTPVFLKSSPASMHFFYDGFSLTAENKDSEGSIFMSVNVRGQKRAECVKLISGFFSFKFWEDAELYKCSLFIHDKLEVRKILLLDVIAEYNTTEGKTYMSKIFYIF